MGQGANRFASGSGGLRRNTETMEDAHKFPKGMAQSGVPTPAGLQARNWWAAVGLSPQTVWHSPPAHGSQVSMVNPMSLTMRRHPAVEKGWEPSLGGGARAC